MLKKLILQGLIKLMEEDVWVKCRKSDLATVQSVVEDCIKDYKAIMKKEVPRLRDVNIQLVVHVSDEKFLPEYSENGESCIGGIQLFSNKGRIVCSNTLDERLQLAYGESIPQVRQELFPSIKKKN